MSEIRSISWRVCVVVVIMMGALLVLMTYPHTTLGQEIGRCFGADAQGLGAVAGPSQELSEYTPEALKVSPQASTTYAPEALKVSPQASTTTLTEGTWGTCAWKYDESTGTLTIAPKSSKSGKLPDKLLTKGGHPLDAIYDVSMQGKLKKVEFVRGVKAGESVSYLLGKAKTYNGSKHPYSLYIGEGGIDASQLDLGNVTDCSYMYAGIRSEGNKSDNHLILRNLTGKITNRSYMFSGANFSFREVGSNLFQNVTNAEGMFRWGLFAEIWYTVDFQMPKITNMSYMFADMPNLRILDISGFDNRKATCTGMFENTTTIEEFKIGPWWDTSKPGALPQSPTGRWWSEKTRRYLTNYQIAHDRKFMYDTYYATAPVSKRGSFSHAIYRGAECDLDLVQQEAVVDRSKANESVTIELQTTSGDKKPALYAIVQCDRITVDDTNYSVVQSGPGTTLTASKSDFERDRNVYAIALDDANHVMYSKQLFLSVKDTNQPSDFCIGKNMKFTGFPEPFQDWEFSLSGLSFPVTMDIETDGKLTLGINWDVSKNPTLKKQFHQMRNEYIRKTKGYKKADGSWSGYTQRMEQNDLKKALLKKSDENSANSDLFGALGKSKCYVMGMLEGDFRSYLEGTLIVGFEMGDSYEFQILAHPPVIGGFGWSIGADAKATGKAKFNASSNSIADFDMHLGADFAGSATLSVGLGIKDVAGISAYGTMGLKGEIGLYPLDEFGLRSLIATGKAGFKGETFKHEVFNLVVVSGDTVLYQDDRNNLRTKVTATTDSVPQLTTQSMAPRFGSVGTTIEEDSYDFAKPQVVTTDFGALCVWSSGVGLCWSTTYDGSSWSEASDIDLPCSYVSMADLTPDGEGGAWLVFSGSDSSRSLEDSAATSDLYLMHYTGSEWTEAVRLTSGGTYAEMYPHVGAANGAAYVAWCENPLSDITGDNGTHAIRMARISERGLVDACTDDASGTPVVLSQRVEDTQAVAVVESHIPAESVIKDDGDPLLVEELKNQVSNESAEEDTVDEGDDATQHDAPVASGDTSTQDETMPVSMFNPDYVVVLPVAAQSNVDEVELSGYEIETKTLVANPGEILSIDVHADVAACVVAAASVQESSVVYEYDYNGNGVIKHTGNATIVRYLDDGALLWVDSGGLYENGALVANDLNAIALDCAGDTSSYAYLMYVSTADDTTCLVTRVRTEDGSWGGEVPIFGLDEDESINAPSVCVVGDSPLCVFDHSYFSINGDEVSVSNNDVASVVPNEGNIVIDSVSAADAASLTPTVCVKNDGVDTVYGFDYRAYARYYSDRAVSGHIDVALAPGASYEFELELSKQPYTTRYEIEVDGDSVELELGQSFELVAECVVEEEREGVRATITCTSSEAVPRGTVVFQNAITDEVIGSAAYDSVYSDGYYGEPETVTWFPDYSDDQNTLEDLGITMVRAHLEPHVYAFDSAEERELFSSVTALASSTSESIDPMEITTRTYKFNVSDVEPRNYTGEAIEPSITVISDDGYELERDEYDVAYENNTLPGTATITVKGLGEYKGQVETKHFTINKRDISSAAVFDLDNAIYTGKVLSPKPTVECDYKELKLGVDYRLVYENNTNAGNASVNIIGIGNNTGSLTKVFKIAKAANPITATAKKREALYKTVAKKAVIVQPPISVSKYRGTVTYTKVSGSAALAVNKSTGKVTVKKGTKQGAYTIRIKATAAGNANYKSRSKTVNCTVVVVSKLTNPITSTASVKSASAAKLKKQAVTVARPLSVFKAKGKVTYKKAKGPSFLTVNKSTGKVTVKKGTKKGSYTIKIEVTAAGNTSYKSATKTVTTKITVK